jgi:hypothetical protein
MQLITTYLTGDMQYLHGVFGQISGSFLNIEAGGNSDYHISFSRGQSTP